MSRANRYFLPGHVWHITHRYHATDVDMDRYLAHCMVYVDLNMVRAGVVSHKSLTAPS